MTHSDMCFTSRLSFSLPPITHTNFSLSTQAGTAQQSQAHFSIYIKVCFTSFPQTFFFFAGARFSCIPDVPITFHSWIHLNLPRLLSFLLNTHVHVLYCFICPHVAMNYEINILLNLTGHIIQMLIEADINMQYKLLLPWT